MKKLISAWIIALIMTTPCAAATIQARSNSLTDVQSAVDSAAAEDTVTIPAGSGSATWSDKLLITKGINLIGPGASRLTINGTGPVLIQYNPNSVTANFNYALRISGFSANLDRNKGIGLCSSNKSGTSCAGAPNSMGTSRVQTKIRIDNINFTGSAGPAIEVLGAFRGVIYSNIFDGFSTPQRHFGTGSGQSDWRDFGAYVYGSTDNMYYEDNTYRNVGGYMVSDCDQGGRYVYRYNTISLSGELQPLFDFHGGRASYGLWGSFGGEVYGNKISANGYNTYLMSMRGGKALAFYNSVDTTGTGDIRVYSNECPPEENRDLQLINNAYFWANRRGSTGALLDAAMTFDDCGYIRENVTFFHDAAPFTGAAGVGVGTLAQRPATCSPGVGYWATTQSYTSLTGMVGVSPATPISGTLYKCTAPNTWTAYYTPLAYPHPLRSGISPTSTPSSGQAVSPKPPRNLRLQ